MKFTLKQLKYANEVCFRADFEKLLNKYLPDDANYHLATFVHTHKCDLISWIFQFSRSDCNDLLHEIIDQMIVELIGDYQ